MLLAIFFLVVGLAFLFAATILLWLLNYVLDGIELIQWLEQGAWKLPVFGSLLVVIGVIAIVFKRDASWEALENRCIKSPKLLRQWTAYTYLQGLLEIGEIFYPITVVGTEQGILLLRSWKRKLFLPWSSISEIRVDWTNYGGQRADAHLPNYDAPSFILRIPWSTDLAWWVPDSVVVWDRGEPQKAL